MEEYSNITPDRDRAFDTAHMNELLSLGKTMLAEAIRISSDMEKAITGISTIYAAIDGEHKNAALGSDIENLAGTLIKDCYQDTMDEMDTLLTRLISDMPSNDSSLAGNHYAEITKVESDDSLTWIRAEEQYEYFSNPENGYINGDVININSVNEIKEAIEDYNIQKGDLMYFVDEHGEVYHSTIISSVNNDMIYFAGNSSIRFDRPLEYALYNCEVYVIHMNDFISVNDEKD